MEVIKIIGSLNKTTPNLFNKVMYINSIYKCQAQYYLRDGDVVLKPATNGVLHDVCLALKNMFINHKVEE